MRALRNVPYHRYKTPNPMIRLKYEYVCGPEA
jgi:hypothetical protein